MKSVVPFPGIKERWRTRCLDCGAECDYLLNYLLELHTRDEPACRLCHWRLWVEQTSTNTGPITAAELAALYERNGFEPVDEITALSNSSLPVLTRCKL
ncbi:hypothetical protein, partial [Arthrobacter sp. lap29]|uniref:hypothetical protein n=1 Tax=Arthrobacter sp. lap29 TaxID=3056122 RepID=UPI0028F6C35D